MQLKGKGGPACKGTREELAQKLCAFVSGAAIVAPPRPVTRAFATATTPFQLPPAGGSVVVLEPTTEVAALPPVVVEPAQPLTPPLVVAAAPAPQVVPVASPSDGSFPPMLDVRQPAPTQAQPLPVAPQSVVSLTVETKPYFVFGAMTYAELKAITMNTNLTPPQSALAIGYGLFFAGRSSKWGGGVASIAPQQGSVGVQGSLYYLTETELAHVDRFVALETGHARETIVVTQGTTQLQAITHIPKDRMWINMPSPQYMQAMQAQRQAVGVTDDLQIIDQFGVLRI